MRLELQLQEALELVRVEVAADHQAQTVRNEVGQVVIGHDLGILLEESAVFGIQGGLDGHQSVLTDLDQDVIHALEKLYAVVAVVAWTFDNGQGAREGL